MNTATFKGFKNWVEIFRSGTHTDSSGKTKTWTHEDLDQIVGTHSANDGAALVIGHPKQNSPRYGEVSELKRDGDSLFAKFVNVPDAVESAAEKRAYPKRSAKIASTPKGLKLIHVGLLGAAPPAIEGLADVYAAEDEGETFEFSWQEGAAISSLARMFRGMRDFVIEKFDLETADRVIPSYEIESAERLATQIQDDDSPRSTFSAHEDTDMPFTQEQLDAAVAAERTKTEAAEARVAELDAKSKAGEFAAQLATNTAFISGLISDKEGNVRLTPAEAAGWAEALTFAQGIDATETEFTFSAPDKSEPTKQNLYEFMKAKLSGRAPQLKLNKELGGEDAAVDASDSAAISKAASEFMASEEKAGRTVNIAEAVTHVVNKRQA